MNPTRGAKQGGDSQAFWEGKIPLCHKALFPYINII